MSNNIFYVYEHWRLDKDECFYVGKGKGDRAYRRAGRGSHWENIVYKLERIGSAYEIKIVAFGLTEKEAFNIEKKRISFWRDIVDLANKTDGGDGVSGLKMSAETKQKMRAAKVGKPGKSGTTGMKFSDETKAKMSSAKKGKRPNNYGKTYTKKPLTEEHRKKLSLAKAGKTHSAERRKITSDAVKAWWAKRKAEEFQ